MANLIDRLVMAGLISLLALPVQAQEAAFDHPTSLSTVQPAQHMQIKPISTSAPAQESVSNLKHWSRFSQSSARPMFVRVPAGTKVSSNESHYVRPTCIQPGSVKANVQTGNGPVKRYLAYNVAPGAGTLNKASSSAAPKKPSSSTSKTKSNNGQVVVLGYGKNSGEVTYSTMPSSRRVAVSVYPRYR